MPSPNLLVPVGAAADEGVFLIGRPPMSEFLSYITGQTLEGQTADQRALADEWRAAHDRIVQLEQNEGGLADSPPVGELPISLAHLSEQLVANPIVQRSFAAVPFEIGLVELDRLVVFQKNVNLSYVRDLAEQLGPDPDEERVFRFCFPLDRRYDPQVRAGRIGPNSWTLASRSNDLRVLDLTMVDPAGITDLDPNGAPVAMIGALVGYGSNYLNAVRVDGRLILNNGSHRAYTLREMGLTHAPCLIQNVTRHEELEFIGLGHVEERADLFLANPRPPLLKDYFDPQLRRVVHIPRTERQIRIVVQVESLDVPSS